MTEPQFAQGAIDLGALAQQSQRASQAQQEGGAGELNVNAGNVQQLVEISNSTPVVVLIGTQRSEASVQLRQHFQELSTEMPAAFRFAYVDADQAADVAQMFGVRALPTVVALYQGQPLANFEGAQPKEALQQWINAIQKATGATGEQEPEQPAEDPRFAEATQALNQGDFDAAIAVYEKILASEPKNLEAQQARDNVRLLQRLEAHKGEDPIALADASPEDISLAFAAADAQIANGDAGGAFDRLIALLRQSSGKEKNEIRERLVELFALFPSTDPRVLRARGEMANALF
ncbi:tetratricopeptide repeat protein [Corynebacterium pelargi]|uniref:Thioredoxin C-1 n=1 Tax=Corynebacterium pelargi TaxID=1471400 RepID=A0A410W9E0_9CORY|nr:tetratricopeptide repeat protein [Corynebacterium pelargi]QAU52568.1 Thioredoxin C-1 [Corynebacterium pelargi]GGG77367.1 thioredoxin [Corynebacterium pelargi]